MNFDELTMRYPARDLPPGAEVVRIAPSPTGYPHIGTALQAALNRAIATASGGIFILRIEDTDQKRLVEGAVDEIIAALSWLGLPPDEGAGGGGDYGPYYQSERLDLYQAAATWLVEQGHAYYCFCTPERLDEVRKAQQKAGQRPMYDQNCRHLPADEVANRLAAGEEAVIRQAVPADEEIAFVDFLRGDVSWQSENVDDSVILKSDGFPTYHLAVVVDDHLMGVTTVIRGEEWIPSTPKHLLLYRAFGWDVPRIIHTPLLRDAKRRKLSKRSGDTSIIWYQKQGYLPEGFVNFLTRIIWPHPDNKDVYDYDEFVERFDPSTISISGPIVDHNLLEFINQQYLRELSPDELYDGMVEWLERITTDDGGNQDDLMIEMAAKAERENQSISREELIRFKNAFTMDQAFTHRVLQLEPERFKKFSEIALSYGFFFPGLFNMPNAAQLTEHTKDPALTADLMEAWLAKHNQADDHDTWSNKVRAQATEGDVKARVIFMTIRMALTGSNRTPPLYDIIQVLGLDETHRRIELAIEVCRAVVG